MPIGPGDRFFPWWGGYGGRFGVVGFNRFGEINRFGGIAPLHAGTRFSNLAHINDAHIAGGVSTVSAGKFGAGRTTAVAATHEQLSSAHMMTGNLPVVPSRASLSASGRAAAPSTIHNSGSQHFAGTQSASHPESFQQQTAHLQQSMQQSHFSPVTAGRSTGATESRSTSTAAAGRSSSGASASGRDTTSSASRAESGSSNRGEWQTFTPSSHTTDSASRSGSGAEASGRGESGSYWNRTASSSTSSREGSTSSGRSSYSRPQLNMRQPIAQPRSSGSYGGYHGGYSGGATHSAPSSGGGSHPSGGSGHSGGGHH